MSELQVAADRSSASAQGEFHNLTGSLLNLPLCAAYNDSPPCHTAGGAICLLLMWEKKKKKDEAQNKRGGVSKRHRSEGTR